MLRSGSICKQQETLMRKTNSVVIFLTLSSLFSDKLHNLRRQKEKLEEKIMDQYRFYEPSVPRR